MYLVYGDFKYYSVMTVKIEPLHEKTRSDTNRAVQSQKQARMLIVQIYEEERLHYICSENKGHDQL